MTIQSLVLAIHNVMRWVVVVLAVLALVRAYLGWFGNRPWTRQDQLTGTLFVSMLDIQLLLGLILVALAGFGNLGAFLTEHVIPMILAVVLAHFGSLRARRAEGDQAKHRTAAIWYTVAVLVVLVSIPWPPRRPLLPRL